MKNKYSFLNNSPSMLKERQKLVSGTARPICSSAPELTTDLRIRSEIEVGENILVTMWLIFRKLEKNV